jgi:membrane dipeptidase
MKHRIALFAALLALAACSPKVAQPEYAEHLRHARSILKTTPIVDTHIDFPWHLVEREKWFKLGFTALALSNPEGDFDLRRAKKGGLYGAFMSIYIPSRYQSQAGRSRQVADSLIDVVNAVARDYPQRFALCPRADDVLSNFKKGIVALPMGMENGSPIEKIGDVAYFHQRGIRYVTLTHALDNQIADSSYDTLGKNGGLSDFGREVVREMNRVGIMVDVSHLSDAAISDVLTVARKPLLASHSACRNFTKEFQRNLPDSLIRAIARTGGVVQVPFSQYFLSAEARASWQKADAERESKKILEFGPQNRAFYNSYGKKVGEGAFWLSARAVADHIDYIKNLVGIDHVGIGSDFDGVGSALPRDLADVGMYPNLVAELLRRGYSEADIRKVCSENVLRVWRANE